MQRMNMTSVRRQHASLTTDFADGSNEILSRIRAIRGESRVCLPVEEPLARAIFLFRVTANSRHTTMAQDSFTETTRTGLGSRLGNSIKGLLFGGLIFISSFVLLWWNEGRSVRTAKGLAAGEKVTVDVVSDKVDHAADGKLVHTTGRAEGRDEVKDALFGVTAPGLVKLQRHAENYQWVESKTEKTETKFGGSEEKVTTYTYTQKWDEGTHGSEHFHKPEGHTNPRPIYTSKVFQSQDTRLGAYRLPLILVNQWDDYQPHPLPTVESLPEAIRSKASVDGDWLYIGGTPDAPKVGDARVRFESVPPGDASVLAQQVKDSFEAYETGYGTTIARIASGVQSAKAMFSAAKTENTIMTWVCRVSGFFLMFLGLSMVLNPLRVVADVVPFIGNLVGAGTGLAAFLLAGIGSAVTIALAWVFYRPALGIALLLIAAGAAFLLAKAITKGKAMA
jgi:hypothetical protein